MSPKKLAVMAFGLLCILSLAIILSQSTKQTPAPVTAQRSDAVQPPLPQAAQPVPAAQLVANKSKVPVAELSPTQSVSRKLMRSVTPNLTQGVATKRAGKHLGSEELEEQERDGEDEMVLKRNGKQIRIERERERPGARFDQPDEAIRAYVEQRVPAGEQELPTEKYFVAREKIAQMKPYQPESHSNNKTLNSPNAPTVSSWQKLGPGNVGGRTRAIIIDPVTPNTLYAAGVAGGIWKTIDGGANWNPLDDFMPNIAVNCLAFEPGTPTTIYAGTGEGYFNGDAVRGAGIFKSIDAGLTWTRLGSTINSDFFFVQDIVVGNGANSQHVYAATRTGVWRSLDGGANWTQVIISNAANGANGAMDLAIRTDQPTDYVFAAVGHLAQSHIWRNTDAGGAGTWVDVYSEANMERTSLAIAPSNQSVIYAMAASLTATPVNGINYQDGLLAVLRSTSNGDTGSWTTQVRNTSSNKQDTLLLMNPVNAVLVECGFGATNNFLSQGWYDNVLAVDPSDSDKVWAGGIDVWRSDNGGVNWAVASYWWFQGNGTPPNNGDPQLVHADNHAIVFHPNYNGTTNQTLYIGDDGGIYKTDNAKTGNVGYVNGTSASGGTVTSSSPICGNEFTPGGFFTVPNPVIWGPLNNGYAVTQFWPGAIYPDGMTYMGGTQDNGTNRGTDAGGSNAWSRILGGDGGFSAVDPTNTNVLYGENTNLSFQKSTNGGASFVAARTGITEASGNFLFTAPFIMDPTNSARLYLGGARVWKTVNSAGSWASASGFLGFRVSALAVSPQDANYGLFGGQAGHIWRTQTLTTDAIPAGTTSTYPFARPRTDFASWVTFDPTDKNIAYATYSTFDNGANLGHVFKSIDAGVTWTRADGNQTPGNLNAIPDIPAHCVLVTAGTGIGGQGKRIYVGTDLGIFFSLDDGATWFKDLDFPNVVVKSINLVTVAGVPSLYAFTHGRGAFRQAAAPTAAPAFISGQVTTPDGAPVAGVTINLGGARAAKVITDAQGKYRFSNVDTDNFYTVTPSITNYHFAPADLSFSLLTNKSDASFTATRDPNLHGNVIDTPDFFVRQHYLDFLGREPDEAGFNFWSDQIISCGADAGCAERRTINVSAAYFLSIEFMETGGLVDGLYRASYNRRPQFAEFMPDTALVATGVVVGSDNWAATLAANKQSFIDAWMQRSEFRAAYDGLSNNDFVDTLLSHAGGFDGNRQNLIGGLNSGALTRSGVLRQVVENSGFASAKRNGMFVMMEYFGYLRRDPDQAGFDFWLKKLNDHDGNFEQAEMVKSFIVSGEYRARFPR